MKKLILILLIATTTSCNVIKNIRKETKKEEVKIEQVTKVDSIAEVKIEKEIVETITTETKTDFFDLSEVTIFEQLNDSGKVINRTTTTKTNIKTNIVAKGITDKKETAKESKKIELSKLDKSKTDKSLIDKSKIKQVEKTSLPNWLWLLLLIVGILLILFIFWKLKKKYISIVS